MAASNQSSDAVASSAVDNRNAVNCLRMRAGMTLQQQIEWADLINAAAYGVPDGLQREIDAFGMLFDSADVKEGATAFLEKRTPLFTGE